MKKLFSTLLFSLIVIACSSDSSEIKDLIHSRLEDPGSAKFGELRIFPAEGSAKNMRACITVNAKNSMGGYTGEQTAVFAKGLSSNSKWHVVHMGTMAFGLCN